MKQKEIQKLVVERDELHHEILSSALRNDVMGVLNSISEFAPRMLEIDRLFVEESVDVESILSTFETVVEVEVRPEEPPGSVELQTFIDEIRSEIRKSGYSSLNPSQKDKDRISKLLAKSHRSGAASSMAKLTKSPDKLFRRGLELINRGHPKLAADFFLKLTQDYDVDPPKTWAEIQTRNERAPKKTEEISKQIVGYTPSRYTDEQKVLAFDAIMHFTTKLASGIIEGGKDPSNYGVTAVRYLMALLGPTALRASKLEGRRTLLPDNLEDILTGEED